MTAFATADADLDDVRIVWELKTVNGRGLEIRVRLPAGFEGIERDVRDAIAARLARGTCAATLKIESSSLSSSLRIDETAFTSLLEDARRLARQHDLPPPDLGLLLGIRGVVKEVSTTDATSSSGLREPCLSLLREGLARLDEARRDEGQRLHAHIVAHLDGIGRLLGEARPLVIEAPARLRARIKAQVDALLGGDPALDRGRLHQEATLLAARSDVSEEIDRLDGHQAAARDLIAQDVPVGRRLDFLAQEMHREANTLCSKSCGKDVTMIGLELKVVIDRFREQVQNVQ